MPCSPDCVRPRATTMTSPWSCTGNHTVLLQGGNDNLETMRKRLKAWLAAAAVPHDLASDLIAAANEACSNSIEHAYRNGGGPVTRAISSTAELLGRATSAAAASTDPGLVELTAECDTQKVVILVADTGTWKPRSADPGPRGRGIDMMRALTEELEIDHSGLGTRVRMSVTLPAIKSPVANPLRGTNRQFSG